MNRIKIKIVKLFALITFVLQSIQAASYLESYLKEDINLCENRNQMLKALLKQIELEDNFSTCVVFGKTLTALPVEEMLQKDLRKVMIVHENINSVRKCRDDFKNFLLLAYWHEQTSLDLFNDLAHITALNRHNKILVIKNTLEITANKTDIERFFSLSNLFKFPNLVLIFKDFHKTFNLYQFQIFPKMSLISQNFKHKNFSIFPNKVKNLQGAALRTMPDQIVPKTAAFKDRDGHVKVKGYIMKFLLLFSNYLNATLHFPLNITVGNSLELRDIFNLTQHNFIDIPAGLLNCQSPRCSQYMSDVYEINNLCLVVPLEQPYAFKDFLTNNVNHIYVWFYFAGRVLLSMLLVLSTKVWSFKKKLYYPLRFENFLVNVQVVAGMFGGSFKLLPDPSKSVRFIYISLFFFGLINTIITCTRIQTFFTHPFAYRIRTLQDLVPLNLRVLITQNEYQNLLRSYQMPPEKVALIFKTVPRTEEFFETLSSFNTSFAYFITSPLWFTVDALQNYRNKPLFRLTDVCLPRSNFMAFMLPSNSLFLKPLNSFIARVRDMGLLDYWLKTCYIDMVKINKLYIPQDRVIVKKSFMMGLRDFHYLWEYMINSYLCSLIAFIGELLYNRLWGRRRL